MAIKTFAYDKDKGSPVSGYSDVIGYWVTTYEGKVLETRERNYYDDSDFYALVWDDDANAVISVDYATTRGWTYLNSATVDATDEVKAKAAKFYENVAFEALKAKAAEAARKVAVGKSVKVVKGRKVPKGTEGTVFWVGPGRAYSYYAAKYGVPDRVGFKDAAGTTFWTAASNLEVTDAEEWLADLEDLKARAAGVGRSHFISLGSPGMAVLA